MKTDTEIQQQLAQAQRACDALNRSREFVCKAALAFLVHDEAESVSEAVQLAQELTQALEKRGYFSDWFLNENGQVDRD